jgi:hypothetical protein
MADAGEATPLAAVVDLITSVHFELQDGFLSSDGVGDAFGRGGSSFGGALISAGDNRRQDHARSQRCPLSHIK